MERSLQQHPRHDMAEATDAARAAVQGGWTEAPTQPLAPLPEECQQPPPSAGNDRGELGPGVEVAIGPHQLRCLEVLGSGSYSIVWRAEVLSPGSLPSGCAKLEESQVALKDVFCKNHSALRQSLFEVQLLLALERKVLLDMGADSKDQLRVPLCYSYKVDSHEEGWRVRTAMTCLPGKQLDSWLGQAAEKAAADLVASQVPAGWISHLRTGCVMAARLVCQVGPTLEHLAPLAWHRDVNSHNILISDGAADGGTRSQFSLCDLGLAVDSRSWASGQGDYWRTTDIGGDCRYWPASSWMVHCYGADYLTSQEAFCRQYQTRLDVHGIGITAVEIVCSTALAARRAGAPPCTGTANAPEATCDECFAHLLDAWYRFHENVSTWWETIYQVFASGGDFRPIHSWLVQENVSEKVVQFMADLRRSLRDCARAAATRGWLTEGRLLHVLAELTDEASRLELQEARAFLAQGVDNELQREVVNTVDAGCHSAGRLPTPVVSVTPADADVTTPGRAGTSNATLGGTGLSSTAESAVTFCEVPEVIEVACASVSQPASPLINAAASAPVALSGIPGQCPPGERNHAVAAGDTPAAAAAHALAASEEMATAATEDAKRVLNELPPLPSIVAVAAAAVGISASTLGGGGGGPWGASATGPAGVPSTFAASASAARHREAELLELREAQTQLRHDLERLRLVKQNLQYARRAQEAQRLSATPIAATANAAAVPMSLSATA